MKLFRSPRTAIHLVTVLEEMPVQETADGIEELRSHGIPVGGVVVNLTRPKELDADEREDILAGRLTADEIAPELARAGLSAEATLVDDLLSDARDHAERRSLEDEQRRRVERLEVPSYELPRLADGMDLGCLYELAAELREQGMA